MIGFEPNLYTVSEGDGQVILTVSVLSGSLGAEVKFFSPHMEKVLSVSQINTIDHIIIIITAIIMQLLLILVEYLTRCCYSIPL